MLYDKQAQYKIKCKERAFDYMGRKCNSCGLDEPIMDLYDFHHIEEKQKFKALNEMFGSYGWPKIRTELNKCIMLCANCHRRIHYIQRVGADNHTFEMERLKQEKKSTMNYWTEARELLLKEIYNQSSTQILIETFPGLSIYQIRKKARELKLFIQGDKNWTEEEDKILQKYYKSRIDKTLMDLLPDRHGSAIRDRAYRLGLTNKDRKLTTVEQEQLKIKIRDLRRTNKTQTQIADILQLSVSQIAKVIATLQNEIPEKEWVKYGL
jgi:hypothetical protein